MPVLNGHEATNKIRQIEIERSLPRTKIVALTAHAMKEDEEKAYESGHDYYMAKPIRKNDLLLFLEEQRLG